MARWTSGLNQYCHSQFLCETWQRASVRIHSCTPTVFRGECLHGCCAAVLSCCGTWPASCRCVRSQIQRCAVNQLPCELLVLQLRSTKQRSGGKKNKTDNAFLDVCGKMQFKFSPFLHVCTAKCCSCSPILYGIQKSDLSNAFLDTSRHHREFLALHSPGIIKCVSVLESEQGCSWPEASLITPEKESSL